ncbi:MAG: glycosyltransferase family 4 protein [Oribacterium sp.]|nr:glycosyltransferase family 4 protein [Oribacterium sp.]
MKVIYFATDNYALSGAFICLVQLAQEMKDRGVDVKVVLPVEGDGTKLLVDAGIPYELITSYNWDIAIGAGIKIKAKILVKYLLNLRAIHKITEYLKKEKPDIVHINSTYSYVGAVAAYKLNIPVVWHIREFFEEDQNNQMWNKKKGYALMSKASAILSVSQALFDKYRKIFPEEKLHVINDGVVEKRFYAPDRKIFTDDIIRLVCVGGLYRYKGQTTLIEALAEYMKRKLLNEKNGFSQSLSKESTGEKYSISLSLVGEGTEEQALKNLAEERGISELVHFEGYSSEPEKFYKAADISFMTSKSEAFGLVTVEAMLSGALVIGADCAGTKDIIEDKKTGLLYEPGNYKSLADAIEYALNNRVEMQQIVDRGRQRAVENFTTKVNAEHVKEIYDKIIYL